jgi:hypothetical protein
MQAPGNLVLYNAAGAPIWFTGTSGVPGTRAVMQDDGNLVLRAPGDVPTWASNTYGGHFHPEKSWIEDVASAAASPFTLAAQGVRALGDALGEIPFVGPAFHGVFLIASGPFTFTDQVLHGERIDRALVNDLSDKIKGVKEVAPYAKTVISFIPGIGTGAAAAIGAGLALASGTPIDEAVIEGVKDALPGGDIAKAAFTVTVAAVQGQNIAEATGRAAIRALGLPPEGEKAFNVVYRAAQGENIPLAVLDQARSYLPTEEAKRAFDVGLAVAHGKKLQNVALEEVARLAPAQLQQVKEVGDQLIAKTPALREAQAFVAKISPVLEPGYRLGAGLMAHRGVNEAIIGTVRSKLNETERRGFDIAVASYKGAVDQRPPIAIARDPKAVAAYVIYKGLVKHPDATLRKTTIAALSRDAHGKIGLEYAMGLHDGFFAWLKRLVFG